MSSERDTVTLKKFGGVGTIEIYVNGHLYGTIMTPNKEKSLKLAREIKRDLERRVSNKPNGQS